MDNLISRQAAVDALKRAEALTRAFGYHNVIETIRELPSVEQKIIRCKDCKHRYVGGNGMTHYFVCDFMDAQYDDEGFCSHAEREGGKDE